LPCPRWFRFHQSSDVIAYHLVCVVKHAR
jgi:hypothetical protein